MAETMKIYVGTFPTGRWVTVPAGAAAIDLIPAAGANTNIQYNDGGIFGGDANLTWDKTTQRLYVSGSMLGVASGPLAIYGGDATATDADGGVVALIGGVGDGSGDGGASGSEAGTGGVTGNGGLGFVGGGAGGATSGNGGIANVQGGQAFTGDGGNVTIFGGSVATSGDGGSITLTPGTGAGGGVDGTVKVDSSDLKLIGTGSTGIIMYDTTLAGYYRITLDNGALVITAV